jgi:hypothetical protein
MMESELKNFFFFFLIVLAMYSSKRCNVRYKACPAASGMRCRRASQEGRREESEQREALLKTERSGGECRCAHSRRMMRIKR